MANNQRKILHNSTINITGNVNDSNIHIGDTINTGYTSEEVTALIKQIASTFQAKPFDGTCPYKGLDYFEEEDADLFFGREKLVDELVGKVKNSRTVFITGPSGSGKSSLVRAGFIHALKQGQVKGSERWLYATIKPGRDPFEALAIAFSRLKSPELGNYFRQNRNNPDVLHECTESTLGESKNQRLVLFMDQFEEVFTQVSREEERTTFLNLLTHAANIENGRVTLLFAMRSDFVPNCAVYPDLNALLNKQFIQIGSMQPEELVSAIAQPALRVGLKIEPELIAQIINDMKGEPGALPLMSFALKDLFDKEQAKGRMIALTLNGYFENKGINEALQRHADSALAQLNEHEQKLAQSIFSNLIEIGRGTQDTKRTAIFNELIPTDSKPDEVKAVVQKLADARLVTTEEGSEKYTITHEKLIDAWPWLKKLINENRDAITLQNEIASAAKEWEENKRDTSYLYSGGRLANIWEQVTKQKLTLGHWAQEFISTSRTEEERIIQEKREKEKQVAIEKASTKRLRRLTNNLTVLFSIILIASYYWYYTFALESAFTNVKNDLYDTLTGTADQIDGDIFLSLVQEASIREDGLTDDPRFWDQVNLLCSIRKTNTKASPYTYIKGEREGEIIFIASWGWCLDNPDPNNFSYFKQSYTPNDAQYSEVFYKGFERTTFETSDGSCYPENEDCLPEVYGDQFGSWISGYTPIRNSKGEIVGALGVDFNATYISEIQASIIRVVLLNFLGTFILLFALIYFSSESFIRYTNKKSRQE